MNISIVTVHTMGRDAFKPKHASSVSISGVIDTGVNSNTGYVISDDHIKIIIDIQKYVVYNRFVHRRVICCIAYLGSFQKTDPGFIGSKSRIRCQVEIPASYPAFSMEIFWWVSFLPIPR